MFEKGGFPDPQKDQWGRWPPLRAFEFESLPSDGYKLYFECALAATKYRDLDKFLKENPSFLTDNPAKPAITEGIDIVPK